jgi:hypothetical protein
VIGTGDGRSAVPLTGSLKDWLLNSTGAHVSSIVDKAIRGSPALHENSQDARRGDLDTMRALTAQISNIGKLADFLEKAGYTSTYGACDLTDKDIGTDTRLALDSKIAGITVSINSIDWVNRATHAQVQKLVARLTKGGTSENQKRLQVMDKISANAGVTGFPRLETALKKYGFLNQGTPMTKDTDTTPLQLGKLPAQPEATIINEIATASSAAGQALKIVDAAIASEPANIDPQKAKSFARLKAVSDAMTTAGFANIPPDLQLVVQWMETVKWTQTLPDFSKLNQIPDAPIRLWLFQELTIADARDWIKTASDSTVDDLVGALTNTTTPAFQRFKLSQVLQNPEIDAQFLKQDATYDLDSTQPSHFGKWAILAGWLRPNPPPLSQVKTAPLKLKTPFYGPTFVWEPKDQATGPVGAGAVNFNLQYAWDSPPADDGDRPGQTLQSLFVGPTLAGGDPPRGLSGPVTLTGGSGWVEPAPPGITGQMYTSKAVSDAWKAANAKLAGQIKLVTNAVSQ